MPVPVGAPPKPPIKPNTITYGVTGDPAKPPQWTLTCGAAIGGGWSLDCSHAAILDEPSNSSHIPTQVSVAGSGVRVSGGWNSTFGQPVTLKAAVSARSGSVPKGKVTFFAFTQPPGGGNPANVPHDLLGIARLSTHGAVATATLRLRDLAPGNCAVKAFYSGSATDLPASSPEPRINENVSMSATTSALTVAHGGKNVILTAHIKPSVATATHPGGIVSFGGQSLTVGSAPVTTVNGKTIARITVPPGAGRRHTDRGHLRRRPQLCLVKVGAQNAAGGPPRITTSPWRLL